MTGQRCLVGGVEAGGTKFICGIADCDGSILASTRIPTGIPSHTLDDVAVFFERGIQRFGALSALAVGSFGPLSLRPSASNFGSITATPKSGWSDTDLMGFFRSRFGVPVVIDTDVNCAAIGERLFGSGRGLDSFCYTTIGTGIGVATIVRGTPHCGANHPEAGHILIPRARGDESFGGVCPFHGDCLEGLACGPAVKARWGRSPEELPDGHRAWDIEADYIATLCTSLTYIVRPERIILGGGIMLRPTIYDLVRERLAEKLAGYDVSIRDLNLQTYIAPPTAGSSAGLVGALAMAHQLVAGQWPAHWRTGREESGDDWKQIRGRLDER